MKNQLFIAVMALAVMAPVRHGAAAADCNSTLWSHVYDPTRLQVVSQCITATGTIAESSVDDDGDQHFLIRLDHGQDNLLRKKNLKKKNGDLVGEIVCANPVHLKKARKACANYTNQIPKPTVGSHVRVTGTLVVDTHNGWTEIHPVSSIQAIR